MSKWQFVFKPGAFLLLAACVQTAWAADPPGRVGRVAEVQGTAWIYDAEAREWLQLLRNQTLTEGDQLRTEPGSRVALHVGSSSFWVDGSSEVAFAQLNDARVQMQLAQGDVALRVRSHDVAGEFSVVTPDGRFQPESVGQYRVSQVERTAIGAVWEGRMRFELRDGGASPMLISAGEQARFWVSGGPRYERQRLAQDSFSGWVQAQSRQDVQPLTWRYVSAEMTGAADLDAYGRWETVSDHGAIWFPQVSIDWAPYRHGRWSWSVGFGWTWVDDAPWGFAPFHYGRWVQWRGRWAWVPGAYVARPVYAPALVAWVGGGGPGGLHGSWHGVGWVPLAPREAYLPSYRYANPAYVRRLNEGADLVTVINPNTGRWTPPPRGYANQSVNGAVSVLPTAGARPIALAGDGVPLRALPQAPLRTDLPVPPPLRAERGMPPPQVLSTQTGLPLAVTSGSQELRQQQGRPRDSGLVNGLPPSQVGVPERAIGLGGDRGLERRSEGVPLRPPAPVGDSPVRMAPPVSTVPLPQVSPPSLPPASERGVPQRNSELDDARGLPQRRFEQRVPEPRYEPRTEPRMEPRFEPRMDSPRVPVAAPPPAMPAPMPRMEAPRMEPRSEVPVRMQAPPPVAAPRIEGVRDERRANAAQGRERDDVPRRRLDER